MLDRWFADWAKTGFGARVTLAIFSVLCLLAASSGALYNIEARDYPNAWAEILVFALLFIVYVIWPFRLAWAVRRRGGSYGFWLAAALIFSGVFIAVFYLIRWSRMPVLEEFE